MLVKEPESKFIPAPAGLHQAVCVDVVDLGDVEMTWEGRTSKKHMLRINWQIDERMTEGEAEGQRFVVSKRYTASLHEKSTLRHDLESWRGRQFTDEELLGFDLEKLVGINCQLNVVHNPGKKGGSVFANVNAVVPLSKNTIPIKPEDYTRQKDRPTTVTSNVGSEDYPTSQDWPDSNVSEPPF